jgi:hypothetical protein
LRRRPRPTLGCGAEGRREVLKGDRDYRSNLCKPQSHGTIKCYVEILLKEGSDFESINPYAKNIVNYESVIKFKSYICNK